jgi:hypothetical protein
VTIAIRCSCGHETAFPTLDFHFWKSEIFLRWGLDSGFEGRVVICPSGKPIMTGKRENMAQHGSIEGKGMTELGRALELIPLCIAQCLWPRGAR